MSDYGFVVVHVPHASILVPDEYRKTILLDDKTFEREIRRMTDAFCDELYDAPGFDNRVIAKYSRFVCDVERFRDDKLEKRAKFGQGLMYTRTRFFRKLRNYDEALRNKILEEVYDPHHAQLTSAVEQALNKYGKCLIIDGHSFPARIIARPDNIISTPDFDIGTDPFHTPVELCNILCDKVKELGYSVKVNTPFGGAITPMKFYGQDNSVISVMFEINRRLYMNEKDMTKSAGFEAARAACHVLMRTAADSMMGLTF